MNGQAVLVIDAGSSAIRCHLFDLDGVELASQSAGWPPSVAPVDLPLAREFDPGATLATVYGLVRRTLAESGAEVLAVAITSMRQGVVFLDMSGEAIYVGPNVDLRAVFEGAAIDDQHRDLVYRTTGHLPSFLFGPAKLSWFKGNRPDLFACVRTAVTIPDWLVLGLTGELACEPTLAAEAGLLNIADRGWATGLAEAVGVPLDGDVPLVEAGRVVGRITQDAALATGIPTGTPVTSAGADTQCGGLGLGVTEPGQVAVVAGWSAPVQQVTATPSPSERGATWVGCHLAPERWVAESSAGDTGRAYDWIAGITGRSFEEMEAAAMLVEPGSEGTTAVLGPVRMDMSAIGLRTGGVLFPVPVTMNERGPGHLARATLESTAYAIRANLNQLIEVTGLPPESIALGGGMTRTRLFTSILANVLDADILVLGPPSPPSRPPNRGAKGALNAPGSPSAVGAFVCAMTALGRYDSPGQGGAWARRRLAPVSPDPVLASEYADHYDRWVEASSTLAQLEL